MFDIGDAPLCFGRLDLIPGESPVDPLYIGRISVTDDDLVPLVIDWRAPVAEPFYRATAVEPMGVARRRHFQTRGRRLLGLDDEVFDADATRESGFAVVGEGALLAALEEERTGRMRDIVATIQSEQDEAIRAPAPGILVVAGGPGTGKTAVALHRAAYLLYTHRQRLASQGVLLVGPSAIFLRYIDEVLPSLGEDEVVLSTPAALKPRYRVRAEDPPAVARVKGDARMASVIAAAVADRERPMPRDVVATLDGRQLRMRRRDSARIVERTRARRGTHNERRPFITGLVVDHFRRAYRRGLVDAYQQDRARMSVDGAENDEWDAHDVHIAAVLARGEHTPEVQDWEAELASRVRRLPEVRAALDRMWPVLSGGELLNDLLGFDALIASAGEGVLRPDEQQLLFRERQAPVGEVAWTAADLALVDEADAILGPPSAARTRPRGRGRRDNSLELAQRTVRELGIGGYLTPEDVLARYGSDSAPPSDVDDGEPRTFGHVLVDEAQDLSAMQWRMLARRCPSGSMTLVGDFGQSSRAGALGNWDDVLNHLRVRTAPRRVMLTVNYRTPAEIMEIANRLLPAAAPGVEAARAVRSTGVYPEVRHVSPADLATAAATRWLGAGPLR
jgi:DNA helicase IV